jgi:tetratricopeptide (TPR) repeat protein
LEYGALGENWGGGLLSDAIWGAVGDYIRRDKDPLSIRGGNEAAAYNNRGNLYDKRGAIDNAIADFDQALHHNLKYIDAFMNRGVARPFAVTLRLR